MSIATEFDLPRHPLDVRPEGNAYLASYKAVSPFSCLPDEIIVHILEYLDPVSLGRLGVSCKHLRAFSRFDELWKTHCVLTPPSNLTWRGSWFSTFTGQSLAHVSCEGVFSDTLYRPFLCANTPLRSYSANIPKRNEIDRLCNLTEGDFQDQWTNRPFILTDLVKKWPLTSSWSEDGLSQSFAETVFRAECVDWSMKTYMDYMSNTLDESPLYLFDRAFVEKMNLKVDGEMSHNDYWAPGCFGNDFFAVLGDQRPDYRWLIIGPERSGSTFHKDPNGTSAWNAVITGSKYWIMFPSGPNTPPPPGVFASSDQSEVTTPASIAEWLLGFHEEARQIPGCIEGICRAGEMLHVPSGWWHLVVNLEPSIALTQNFVPKAHLHKVLLFLRDQKQAVSGFRSTIDDPYELFVDRMTRKYPEELQEALEAISRGKKRVWTELTENAEGSVENKRRGFAFGFADYDSDDSNS